MLYLFRILASLFLAFICQNALSGTATGALAVSANVGGDSKCVINGIRNLIFPSYNPHNFNPDDSAGSITVTCTANLAYEVGINRGQGVGAKNQGRKCMKNNSEEELLNNEGIGLEYELFSDPSYRNYWGNESGKNCVQRIGTGLAQVINIYGEIPIQQPVEAGSYFDWLTIFVRF